MSRFSFLLFALLFRFESHHISTFPTDEGPKRTISQLTTSKNWDDHNVHAVNKKTALRKIWVMAQQLGTVLAFR
jgi:hypothetical protein